MQWIAPSEKDNATNTLEKRLWEAADQLRANSGLTAAQYSSPVLGLIFRSPVCMSNASNNLVDFFGLFQGDSLAVATAFFTNKSATFQKSCGTCFNATLTCVFASSLPIGHELRIFEVV